MSSLIYFYDGSWKYAAQFAVVLLLCLVALIAVYDPAWKGEDDDDE